MREFEKFRQQLILGFSILQNGEHDFSHSLLSQRRQHLFVFEVERFGLVSFMMTFGFCEQNLPTSHVAEVIFQGGQRHVQHPLQFSQMNAWSRLYGSIDFPSSFAFQDFIFEHDTLILQNARRYEDQGYQMNQEVDVFAHRNMISIAEQFRNRD